MTLVRRAARPLLAAAFLTDGIDALRNPAGRVADAEKIAPTINRLIPQLPNDIETLVRINGGLQASGGLALSAGVLPRLSATVLAASLIPTTLASHRFWETQDETERRSHRLHFIKNLGLLGGLLLAAVDTEGQPGLAWRARHAGEELQATTRRFSGRARREAKLAARAARQEAKLLRAGTKAKLAA